MPSDANKSLLGLWVQLRSVVVAVAVLGCPDAANAHGGFPTALSVTRVGGTPTGALAIYTNFGVLVDRDGWRLVCEEQYGGAGKPVVVLPTDDVFIAGHFKGIARSEDAGCTLRTEPVAGSGLFVRDFSYDISDKLYLVTSTGGATNGVFYSDNLGKSWNLFGLESSESFYTGIRVLGDTGDLAVSGIDGESGTFFLSYYTASTQKWDHIPIPDLTVDSGLGGQPVLLDCSQAGLQCVVAGTDDTNHRVVEIFRDGEIRTVFENPEAPFVVAGYSPEGRLFVSDGVHLLQMTEQGLLAPVFGIDSPTCISRVGQELFVCSNPYLPDSFLVSRSIDNGESWSVVVSAFDEIRSLQPCNSESELVVNCAAPWAQLASDFGIDPDQSTLDALSTDGSTADTSTGSDSQEVEQENPKKQPQAGGGCATTQSDRKSVSPIKFVPLVTLWLLAIGAGHRKSKYDRTFRSL